VDDCYAAARYLIEHAEEYQLDAHNLFIMGPSAGGSLTLITGLRLYNEQAGQEYKEYTVRALAPLCPVCDLSGEFGFVKGAFAKFLIWYMLRIYLGKMPKKGVAAPFDASFYVKDSTPPIFFQLGRFDPVIKVEYVQAFADKLAGETVIDILEEGYHMGATKHFFLDENIKRYLDFFEARIQWSH